MADNPLITNEVPYSINTFEGDGTTATREFNFSGGYLRREHVKAFQTAPDGTATDVTLTFIGDNTVTVSPVTPVDYVLTIFRDTPKDLPMVDFQNGAIINETNLDTLAEQSVFVSAEMVDRFVETDAIANEALVKSDQAIAIAEATIGGDFTKFARTDLSNTWTASQNLLTGSRVNGVLIATQDYVTASVGSLASSTTTAIATAKAEAIAAAATDATTKANAAKAEAISAATSTAATDATTKVNAERDRAKRMEGFLFCLAFR